MGFSYTLPGLTLRRVVGENTNNGGKDRRYQFWERNPLSVDLYTEAVFLQKLDYVHGNPKQPHWQLCDAAGDYRYSSALFYENGIDNWGFLTHYRD